MFSIFVALIAIITAAALPTSAIEWRLDTYSSTSGALLYKETATDSWKSVAYTSNLNSSTPRALCYLCGFSHVSSASYSSTSRSTSNPTAMNNIQCPANIGSIINSSVASPSAFSDACTYTQTASASATRLFLFCSGVRDGGRLGFSAYEGKYYFRFSTLPYRPLEVRRAHDATMLWGSVCSRSSTYSSDITYSSSENRLAKTVASAAGFYYGTFNAVSPNVAGGATPRMKYVVCGSSYTSSFSDACTFESAFDVSSSFTCSNVYTLNVRGLSSTGAIVGDYWMSLSSSSSGYIKVRPLTGSSTTWGVVGGCSTLTTTTAKKLCRWLAYDGSESTSYRYMTSSTSSRVYMENPQCGTNAQFMSNTSAAYGCTYTDLGANGVAGSTYFGSDWSCPDETSTSSSSSTSHFYQGLRCYSSSSSSSSSGDDGMILGIVVGCIFGTIFLTAVCLVIFGDELDECCEEEASPVASSNVVVAAEAPEPEAFEMGANPNIEGPTAFGAAMYPTADVAGFGQASYGQPAAGAQGFYPAAPIGYVQ